jgi:hypothetical protein
MYFGRHFSWFIKMNRKSISCSIENGAFIYGKGSVDQITKFDKWMNISIKKW